MIGGSSKASNAQACEASDALRAGARSASREAAGGSASAEPVRRHGIYSHDGFLPITNYRQPQHKPSRGPHGPKIEKLIPKLSTTIVHFRITTVLSRLRNSLLGPVKRAQCVDPNCKSGNDRPSGLQFICDHPTLGTQT